MSKNDRPNCELKSGLLDVLNFGQSPVKLERTKRSWFWPLNPIHNDKPSSRLIQYAQVYLVWHERKAGYTTFDQ